jgi:hypothetical protein
LVYLSEYPLCDLTDQKIARSDISQGQFTEWSHFLGNKTCGSVGLGLGARSKEMIFLFGKPSRPKFAKEIKDTKLVS